VNFGASLLLFGGLAPVHCNQKCKKLPQVGKYCLKILYKCAQMRQILHCDLAVFVKKREIS
jgi:hypothetical protein